MIAGMFLDGTFVRKGHYRVDSTGNPALISKSLINKFLKIPAFHDKNSFSQLICDQQLLWTRLLQQLL